MGGIRHGYRGFCRIGAGTWVWLRPGGSYSKPRNLDIPYPLTGDAGPTNHADGLTFPTLMAPFVVQIGTGVAPGWFNHTNVGAWFHDRGAIGASNYDDLSEITGGILFSIAKTKVGDKDAFQRTMSNVKGAGYTLSIRKGEPIGFQARFMGCSDTKPTLTDGAIPAGYTDTVPTRPAGAPVQFDAVILGGALAGRGIIGVQMNVDVGLTPNPELASTDTDAGWTNAGLKPKEMNAGMLSASLSFQTNGGHPVDLDGEPGTITVVQGGLGVTWTLQSIVPNNPDDLQHQVGRVMRGYTHVVKSVDGGPVVAVSQPA